MGAIEPMGFLSLIPVILTLFLAFKTKDAVVLTDNRLHSRCGDSWL